MEGGAGVGVGATQPGQETWSGARPSGLFLGSTTDWLCVISGLGLHICEVGTVVLPTPGDTDGWRGELKHLSRGEHWTMLASTETVHFRPHLLFQALEGWNFIFSM